MRPGLFVFLLLIASNVMAAKTPLIVGVWNGTDGKSFWLVRPDGTAYNSHRKAEGRWRAANKTGYDFIFQWQDQALDNVKINRDKNSFVGFYAAGNVKWTQVRASYPPREKEAKKNPKKSVKKQAKHKKLTKRELSKLKLPNGVYHADVGNHPWTHVYRVNDMIFEWPASIHDDGNRVDETVNRGLVRGKGRFISPNSIEVLWRRPQDGGMGKQIWTITPNSIFIEDWGPGIQSNKGRWLLVIDSNVGSKMPAIRAVNEQPPAVAQPELDEPEEEQFQPFSLDDEPQEEPLEPFSLDDDPVEEEADLPPPTDPEGILDRAGLYEGRPSVWYLKRANNFAARTYEQLSKSSEIRSALRAVNGRLPTKAEMNNPPSRR